MSSKTWSTTTWDIDWNRIFAPAGDRIPRLRNHVVICGSASVDRDASNICNFLKLLCTVSNKQIVYLGVNIRHLQNELKISKMLNSHREQGRILFVEGNSMRKIDLLRVSIQDADDAVLFSGYSTEIKGKSIALSEDS